MIVVPAAANAAQRTKKNVTVKIINLCLNMAI